MSARAGNTRSINVPEERENMRVLVLGGSKFLGYHVVREALARGWEVTVFNRGQSEPELWHDEERVEVVRGDRDAGLGALGESATWDMVVDTSGYVPRLVQASSQLLSQRASSYVFISTISVYDDPPAGADESAPVFTDIPQTEEISGGSYGPLKVACEQAAARHFDGPVASLRAGLLVGPRDYTFRLSYWVHRALSYERILAPGTPERGLQWIDARDVAAFALDLGAQKTAGIFNVTGPAQGLTTHDFMQALAELSPHELGVVWASEEFLSEHHVAPWVELPAWLPQDVGLLSLDITRAMDAGLYTRPLRSTLHDIQRDLDQRPFPAESAPGLERAREETLLDLLDPAKS